LNYTRDQLIIEVMRANTPSPRFAWS